MSFGPTLTGVQQSSYELQRKDVNQYTKVFLKAHIYCIDEQYLQQG